MRHRNKPYDTLTRVDAVVEEVCSVQSDQMHANQGLIGEGMTCRSVVEDSLTR